VPLEPVEADLHAWDAWDPPTIADHLRDVASTWCVVGGWALDLFIGEQTRDHEDLEIAVPQDGFDQVRVALAGYEFFTAGSGRLWPLDTSDPTFTEHHQTWVRDPATNTWKVDVMREPGRGATWVCRRDTRITRPYADVILHDARAIPYLRPEIVLLFKGKEPRAKDDRDFARAAPLLVTQDKSWLATSIADAYGSSHP
jgi:hypothetical protein